MAAAAQRRSGALTRAHASWGCFTGPRQRDAPQVRLATTLTKVPRAAGREVEAGEAGAPGAARNGLGGERAAGEALEMVGLVRQAPRGICLPLQQRVGS